jgi:hypothetical protein
MNTYIVTEKQNLSSSREGKAFQAKDLTAAKRIATREKMFQGTVMTIEQDGRLLAYRVEGKWVNA